MQRCEALRDYQADRWPHPRRIVAQSEVTPQGSQRRFVVTNLDEPAAVVYRDVYIQRGGVPEHPIGARKKGLQADRLSACGFCANAFRLLVPTLAYALVVRFREAAGAVPEVATATVSTLRQRWWQVGAGVGTGVRRIGFHRAESWPGQAVWGRLRSAVRSFVAQVQGEAAALRPTLQGSPR